MTPIGEMLEINALDQTPTDTTVAAKSLPPPAKLLLPVSAGPQNFRELFAADRSAICF